MVSRPPSPQPAPAAVSLSFVLPVQPSRAAAFRAAMTSMLHAGFAFGRDLPGHIVYSFDLAGEQYVDTMHIPAGALGSFRQAQERLSALAPYYNHSIGMSFAVSHGAVPVCARVYDEPGALVFSLDFAAQAWRSLVPERAADLGATGLVNAGRILFTLLPAELLLIGPSELLQGLPARPSERRLRSVPIAMLARGAYAQTRPGAEPAPLYEEQLTRGRLVVRDWDAGKVAAAQPGPAAKRAQPRQTRG